MILLLRGHIRDSFSNNDLYNLVNEINLIDKNLEIYIHTWNIKQTSLSWRIMAQDETVIYCDTIFDYFKDLKSKIKHIIIGNEKDNVLIGNLEGYVGCSLCPLIGWKNYWCGQYEMAKYLFNTIKNRKTTVVNLRFDILKNSHSFKPNEILNFLKRNIVITKFNENKFLSDTYLLGIDNIYMGSLLTVHKLISHFYYNLDEIIKRDPYLINQEKLVYYENRYLFNKRNAMLRKVDQYNPIYIENYNIYDVFYSDDNEIVIIMPMENPKLDIKLLECGSKFKLYICRHKHTYIYKLKMEKYCSNIALIIDENIIHTNVSIYPSFENKIVMSTLVKNENDYIKQWINYHLLLGVSNFVIYDNNEVDDSLSKELDEYIKEDIVIVIKWTYPYLLNNSGFSSQTTQQNHSLHAFRNSKFIGFFDIDEYVNLQNNDNIDHMFAQILLSNKKNAESIGGFKFLNKSFHNPNSMDQTGYNFFKIFDCDEITKSGREKNFIIPKNVNIFSIHVITEGKNIFNIQEQFAYFNHYLFLNKNRGDKITNFKDSTLFDKNKKFVSLFNDDDEISL
jgi:hypothetical protein